MSDKKKDAKIDQGLSVIPSKGSFVPQKISQVEDTFRAYIKQISKHKLLSPEEEKNLTQEFHETGDIEIAKKLVVANLRLVVKIALEYRSVYDNMMDLIQEGNIGLMKAVSKYDPSKGAKLSYYASWWIKSYILKFILDNFRLIKIGTTNDQKKLFFNLMKEKNRLISLGINPDHKTISENLGVSEKAVALMDKRLSSRGAEVSIETPLGDDPQSGNLGSLLAAHGQDIDDTLAHAQGLEILQDNLKGFVEGLKERDKDIFTKRLLEEVPPSLQQIADEYGVSRERIRQIEARLLESLRVYMSEHLR